MYLKKKNVEKGNSFQHLLQYKDIPELSAQKKIKFILNIRKYLLHLFSLAIFMIRINRNIMPNPQLYTEQKFPLI